MAPDISLAARIGPPSHDPKSKTPYPLYRNLVWKREVNEPSTVPGGSLIGRIAPDTQSLLQRVSPNKSASAGSIAWESSNADRGVFSEDGREAEVGREKQTEKIERQNTATSAQIDLVSAHQTRETRHNVLIASLSHRLTSSSLRWWLKPDKRTVWRR